MTKKINAMPQGALLTYNGFGANVGETYKVVRIKGKVTYLNGKIYGREVNFSIPMADLAEAIAEDIYRLKVN